MQKSENKNMNVNFENYKENMENKDLEIQDNFDVNNIMEETIARAEEFYKEQVEID